MLNFKQQQEQIVYQPRIVMGVTKFKDVIDGNEVDTTNVFIATPFNSEQGNAVGFGVAKVKFGSSSNFNRLAFMDFPVTLNLAFKTVTTSSGKSQTVMIDFKPMETLKKE